MLRKTPGPGPFDVCDGTFCPASISHAVWDIDAVHGVHAVHSVSNLGAAGDPACVDRAKWCNR
jgi:hypothetical protein